MYTGSVISLPLVMMSIFLWLLHIRAHGRGDECLRSGGGDSGEQATHGRLQRLLLDRGGAGGPHWLVSGGEWLVRCENVPPFLSLLLSALINVWM